MSVQNLYIKQMALNTVVEFVARTLSQSEFRIKENDKAVKIQCIIF